MKLRTTILLSIVVSTIVSVTMIKYELMSKPNDIALGE